MTNPRPKLTLKLNFKPKIDIQNIAIAKTVIAKPAKQVINKKVKKVKKNKVKIYFDHDKYVEMLKYLADKYPLCFKKNVLLSVGIHKELIKLESEKYSCKAIRKFLKCYTRSKVYKKNLSDNVERVNLQGEKLAKYE